jgi:hypothetical protein
MNWLQTFSWIMNPTLRIYGPPTKCCRKMVKSARRENTVDALVLMFAGIPFVQGKITPSKVTMKL